MSKILAISLLLHLKNLQVQILSFIFLTDSVFLCIIVTLVLPTPVGYSFL